MLCLHWLSVTAINQTTSYAGCIYLYRVATNLEYSGISLNMENPGNSQGILCNLGENCNKQSIFSSSFRYLCKVWWWPVILLELMWNDPWWRSLLHLLFVAITYGKVSLWLWKQLENSGTFFLLCGHHALSFSFDVNLCPATKYSQILDICAHLTQSAFSMTSPRWQNWAWNLRISVLFYRRVFLICIAVCYFSFPFLFGLIAYKMYFFKHIII